MKRLLPAALLFVSLALAAAEQPPPPATPAGQTTFEVIIKDHRFVPAEVTIPAGQKVKLVVKNQDPTPEEFESHSLKREKVIAGNSQATILLGPLEPGEHVFFGEFNEKTAQGKLIVK